MRLEDYHTGSGQRILAGVTGSVHAGKGQVILTIPPRVGMDSHLAHALEILADDLELEIVVGSVDTGVHVPHSRHDIGCAGDIIRIGEMGHRAAPVSIANPYAVSLVNYVLRYGWHIGEGSPAPGVLFGPVHTSFNPTAIPHGSH